MTKIKEWIWRYAPAEIFATIGAIFGAYLLYILTDNKFIAAYAGVVGENICYYEFILIRDFKKNKIKYEKFSLTNFLKIIHNLIVEFGFSEALDTLLVRPFCLYWFPVWISNYSIGIIIGKFAADIIFYIPTITAYELKKKYLKN